MARWSDHLPSYRLHKASGQAVVTLDGRDFLLGPHNSPPSRTKYNQLISRWIANGRRLPAPPPAAITIATVVDEYMTHAESYYRDADGNPTTEIGAIKLALLPVLKLYGATPAAEFDAAALEVVRNAMIHRAGRRGLVRTSINKHMVRIRSMFKWAARKKLINSAVAYELTLLPALKAGRSDAQESGDVEPIDVALVDATLPHCPRPVAAIAELQLLTGSRPGEICTMRLADIDRSEAIWVYRPARHKNLYRGHVREIPLGPRAQGVLAPFLTLDPDAYLFRPSDATAELLERRAARRKTPLHYGNRPGTNRKAEPKRAPGRCYTVASYRRAITRACDAADAWAKGGRVIGNDERLIPRWHPHQLRHTAAKRLREQYGADAAGVILGHRDLDSTAIYAERSLRQAKDIMAKVG